MTYEQVKNFKPGNFKQLCGVQPKTFKGDAVSNATKKQNRKRKQADKPC